MMEYIVSIDDDLKDFDELFVGNVRDGDVLIRCKDCAHYVISGNEVKGLCRKFYLLFDSYEWCSRAEPKENG